MGQRIVDGVSKKSKSMAQKLLGRAIAFRAAIPT